MGSGAVDKLLDLKPFREVRTGEHIRLVLPMLLGAMSNFLSGPLSALICGLKFFNKPVREQSVLRSTALERE